MPRYLRSASPRRAAGALAVLKILPLRQAGNCSPTAKSAIVLALRQFRLPAGRSNYKVGEESGGVVPDCNNSTPVLADNDYPNKGVMLVYNGGDNIFCPKNQPRSLALQFLCHPSSPAPSNPNFATTVVGRNDCNYGIGVSLPSVIH